MPSSKLTIVPAALFDPGKKDEYFTFNHTIDEGNTIISNKINDPESYLVFSVLKDHVDLITGYYPGIHPIHHTKPLFEQISYKRKSVNGNYIHIHVEREFFNLIIFSNNQLAFCNTYHYRNISDILYFILGVFKKLDIKQEETIHCSGMTEKYDDLYSSLSMYIRNIKFAAPSGNFTFSYVFNDTELHRFINLFSAINCE